MGPHLIVFWNQRLNTLVMVVDPGTGLGGQYIGTVHNGAVTTAIHESMQMVAQKWFPQGLSYNLSDLEVTFRRSLGIRGLFCITCYPALPVRSQLLASVAKASAAEKAFDADTEQTEKVRWPDWFGPKDRNVMANSIVAQVQIAPSGHPLRNREANYLHAVGRYQVTEAEHWPPSQTPQGKAFYKIRD